MTDAVQEYRKHCGEIYASPFGPMVQVEVADAAIVQVETERDRLKDALVRIVQCHLYNLTVEDENGQHTVDGFYAPDILGIIHEVFPDCAAWAAGERRQP